MYDVVILGMGAAGLSAALYTAGAGYATAIVGKDGGSLYKAKNIVNYFGAGEISGAALWEKGKEQAQSLGAELIQDEAVGAEYDGSFHIKTVKDELQSKALILALGTARKKPHIAGLSEFEGRGVSYCAVCDGFFFKNKDVAVLGSGNYAAHEAAYLKNIAKSVTILTNGEAAPGDGVITDKIEKLRGQDSLSEVVFENGQTLCVSGLFVAQGFAGSAELAKKLGVICAGGRVKTDDSMKTNLPGCFAAGDCTGGIAQISVAVGEGAKAALSAIEYLKR